MRIWLHRGTGDETGWNAWCLDLVGFATWAPTEAEVLSKVPTKIAEYYDWLERHGITVGAVQVHIQVMEQVSGNEILFSSDTHPSDALELAHTIELLSASGRDLMSAVSTLPRNALDWDPPYRSFSPWASWRSVGEILAHIANTETHYYLPNVGHKPEMPPAAPADDWNAYLPAHREHTVRCLNDLRDAEDRARVSRNEEAWSVRKVLRRLVRHELLHWKSIRRIGREYLRLHS